MTPLYPKETAEHIAKTVKNHVYIWVKEKDKDTAARLIENGNEVMELLERTATSCEVYGSVNVSADLRGMIKKIKGEG